MQNQWWKDVVFRMWEIEVVYLAIRDEEQLLEALAMKLTGYPPIRKPRRLWRKSIEEELNLKRIKAERPQERGKGEIKSSHIFNRNLTKTILN